MDATDTRSGGPAFPTCVSADSGGGLNHGMPGMSLRDWFAGQAIDRIATDFPRGDNEFNSSWAERVATIAYRFADAMLAEREKPITSRP